MTSGCSMNARIRMVPPQREQTSGSTSNATSRIMGSGVLNMVKRYDVGNGIPPLAVADRPSQSVAEA